MSRMIDADALKIDYGFTWDDITPSHDEMYALIDRQPTIEERKTGEWIPFDIPWYQCSECGAVRENKSFMENFCPNCGADMRGGGQDE